MPLNRIVSPPAPGGEGAVGEIDDTRPAPLPGDLDAGDPHSPDTAAADPVNPVVPPARVLADYEALLQARQDEYAQQLAESERRAAEWERACKAAVRERELATVLAGRPLVPGAAAQLVKLWGAEFDVYDDGGSTRVAARDGRTVARAVADWLASPEYAHFCQPTSRGGTAPPGINRSTPGLPVTSPPKTLGDAAIQRWREALSARGAETSSPIGLHRPR